MEKQYEVIPISKLYASKTNPRTNFPEAELKELASSIQSIGIKIFPIVRKDNKGNFEIVDGERRYRAAKMINLAEIKCEVREMNDEEIRVLQLVSFLQKTGLTPVEEAQTYHNWSKLGQDPGMIAARAGKPKSHIVRMLSLLKLIPEVKKSFDKGDLPIGHALEICRLQPREQEKSFEWVMEDFDMNGQPKSLSDLKQFIAEEIHLDLREAAFSKSDAKLCPLAGACTNCSKRSGFNKELFNDITKSDICSDPKCFKDKQLAHLAQVKAQLKTDKKKFIEITRDIRKPDGFQNAITERSFRTIKKGKPCKYAIVGILIDGSSIGTMETICKDKACSQHWGKSHRHSEAVEAKKEKARTPEQVEEDRIAEIKEKVDERANELLNEKILKVISPKVPTVLKREQLIEMADRMSSDETDTVNNALGLKLSYWDNEKKLKALSDQQLIKVIHISILSSEEGREGGAIIEKAKLWGVDVKKCEAEAKGEALKEYAEQLKPLIIARGESATGREDLEAIAKKKKVLTSPMTKAIREQKAAKKK
jgi:ParB family chromosome partitioning protein